MGWKLRGSALEQERIEREPVEQEPGGTNHSAGITSQGDPHIRRLADCSLLPASQGGGSTLYDVFDLQEARVGVVVGDATGKGMPAALVVSATSSMLQ